jgi:hypothetical protein
MLSPVLLLFQVVVVEGVAVAREEAEALVVAVVEWVHSSAQSNHSQVSLVVVGAVWE